MTTSSTATTRSGAETGVWWFLDTLVVERRLASPTATTVLEMTLPVGAAPPMHIHHHYDDSFYVLAGQMVVRNGHDVRAAGPGDWVSTPRGTAHGFRVVGDVPARILIVSDSDSFLDLIREIGVPAAARSLPPGDLGPPVELVLESFAAHDVTVAGESISAEESHAHQAAGG
jgi:quercetin dioxygenase-like cupin family protein